VSVKGNGVGFDVGEVISRVATSDRFGLLGVQERLEQAGGLIQIDSEPGGGSRISMKVPLKCEKVTDGKEL
jgi:signal transduction histidine kinase